MSVKLFLRITTILTALIGTSFILFPLTITNIFLVHSMRDGSIFVRFLGSSLIGYSYLNWYTARYDYIKIMRATIIGNFSTLLIALIISIVGVAGNVLNTRGLLIVALHLFLVVGFGYYLSRLKNYSSSTSHILD